MVTSLLRCINGYNIDVIVHNNHRLSPWLCKNWRKFICSMEAQSLSDKIDLVIYHFMKLSHLLNNLRWILHGIQDFKENIMFAEWLQLGIPTEHYHIDIKAILYLLKFLCIFGSELMDYNELDHHTYVKILNRNFNACQRICWIHNIPIPRYKDAEYGS